MQYEAVIGNLHVSDNVIDILNSEITLKTNNTEYLRKIDHKLKNSKTYMIMDWKTKRILNLERLLKECEQELEDSELRQKIEQILSRQQ